MRTDFFEKIGTCAQTSLGKFARLHIHFWENKPMCTDIFGENKPCAQTFLGRLAHAHRYFWGKFAYGHRFLKEIYPCHRHYWEKEPKHTQIFGKFSTCA